MLLNFIKDYGLRLVLVIIGGLYLFVGYYSPDPVAGGGWMVAGGWLLGCGLLLLSFGKNPDIE